MKKIIAIIEKSAGNAEVGNMWLETKTFDADTPVEKIILWASGSGRFETHSNGRLILSVPDDDINKLN